MGGLGIGEKCKNFVKISSFHTHTHTHTQNNKVDVQFPYILVWKLHTQACEIVTGTKRKPCKKFQVDIYKTKRDRSAHAQFLTLYFRSKP